MAIVTITKDNGQAIVFNNNRTVNIRQNFSIKTFWQAQNIYTYHRPYQANNGIIYHDGKDSQECFVRGSCAYTKENLLTLESLKGIYVRVKHTREDGTVLEDEVRAYVRNIPQPTVAAEALEFQLDLTRVYT